MWAQIPGDPNFRTFPSLLCFHFLGSTYLVGFQSISFCLLFPIGRHGVGLVVFICNQFCLVFPFPYPFLGFSHSRRESSSLSGGGFRWVCAGMDDYFVITGLSVLLK